MYKIDTEVENKEISARYEQLIKSFRTPLNEEDKALLDHAFQLAVFAHAPMRRKTGEPYIYHPLEVAKIAVGDIGLGATAAICALLHDVVEDTDYTLEDIEQRFGKSVRRIIDGLTKIDDIVDQTASVSLQAENFKKMLLTLSDDVRVILIKLADRLHNMRTLDAMALDKQLKIAAETTNIYAPLAHRLGLFMIKSELEDLALKYTEPDVYKDISAKIIVSETERKSFIQDFIKPIQERLDKEEILHSIAARTKSVCSIWGKMKNKGVPFEEVYDLFAIRIVLDVPIEEERSLCYKVYSIITELYRAKSDRFRDWIAVPKGNGYEAVHTTVMSNYGKWVEVQIRSKRMDDIAERGYAAHWKYKNEGLVSTHSGLDEWLNKIREMLESPSLNSIDFLNEFRSNFFKEEIYVYTPKGEVRSFPFGATVLDFAFQIHSEIGNTVIGAKINHKLVPINQKMKSGDQVEIIYSKKQKPSPDWLNYVVTSRAKHGIKEWIREEYNRYQDAGKELLQAYMKDLKISLSDIEPCEKELLRVFNKKNKRELYYDIAKEQISEKDIKRFLSSKIEKNNWFSALFFRKRGNAKLSFHEFIQEQVNAKPETLVIGSTVKDIKYHVSSCCKPIPGDDVIGILNRDNKIEVHRTNCPSAIDLMSQFGNRIVKAKWRKDGNVGFLSGIAVKGFDRKGLAKDVLQTISEDEKINIRSLEISSGEGVFNGRVMLYIHHTDDLRDLIRQVKLVEGVEKVARVDD